MYYFRFPISKELTGREPPGYSPGWHGNMPHCPKNVTVLAYNDAEGYGIAKTDDTFIPPEVEVISSQKATAMLKGLAGKDGVWQGKELAHRWDAKPEPEPSAEGTGDGPGTPLAAAEFDLGMTAPGKPRTLVSTVTKTCPSCHRVVAFIAKYDDGSVRILQGGKPLVSGVICKTINLRCPAGHTVKVVCNG